MTPAGCVILAMAFAGPAADAPTAVRAGLAGLHRAGRNWNSTQTCFSCHHQTLPLFAAAEAAAAGISSPPDWAAGQFTITRDFFRDRAEGLRAGHLPGTAATAAYGLWAFALAGREPDDTTATVAAYLLRMQQPDGRWGTSCARPPMQKSGVASTVLAAYGLKRYSPGPAADEAGKKAEAWLAAAKLADHDDRFWRLWGLHHAGGSADDVERVRDVIAKLQRPDGGWGQFAGRDSDAFSTGQGLFILRKTGTPRADPAAAKAAAFLLGTRYPDGSWRVATRVKPVQRFFDNGDPHGTDQFLSVAATAWATAGLSQMLPPAPPSRPK